MKTNPAVFEIIMNGREIKSEGPRTILDAADRAGIKIPTLCHDPRLIPTGACRLCLVEVAGRSDPVPACATPAEPGMEITTESERLTELRKSVIEMLLSDHPHDCMVCEKCGDCRLQEIAYEYGVRHVAGAGAVHQVREQAPDPFIHRDMAKCIQCARCVRICDEVEAAFAIGTSGKGFDAQVGAPFGKSLKETSCEFCGQCVSTCPTGALTDAPSAGKARTWETDKTLTTCPYCGVGCQLELHTKDNEIVQVTSPIDAEVNHGNLCVKGRYGYKFVNSAERLTKPVIKKEGRFVEAGWDEAIDLVASRLSEIKRRAGADSIAALSSAKCTNEENYVFQKFARAAIGTNNVDHCARLCHSSTVAGLAQSFGSGAMTNSIGDIAQADTILVIGSNTTEAHPIIGIEIIQAVRQGGTNLIVIDPRGIKLTKFADIWLAQQPGSDVAVLNGLMNVIVSEGLVDVEFIEKRTEGFEALKKTVAAYTPEKVEEISGVPASALEKAARMFGEARSGSIFYSMGITQHTSGVDNVLSVANLAMMTGNIGRPGTGVNPLRGQNNVQGSCDMGALPNVFSGYQKVVDEQARARLSQAWDCDLPGEAGLTVVEIMNAATDGDIKGLYIMGENPMLSDPDVAHVEKALENLDFLVVQDLFITETAALADVVLPSVSFAERDGTFTSTERRVQRIRRAIEPIGEAREDWRIISEISTALGYPMRYSGPAEIMDEIARTTPAYGGINYERLERESPQWPCPDNDHPGTPILHESSFARGKGSFSAVEYRPPAEEPDIEFPLVLTTGRILSQYHTGTMIRRSEGIDEISCVGCAEISPRDAKKLELQAGDAIRLITRRGRIEAKAHITDRSRPGIVFMPFHFKESPANMLTNPALDPVAKIPEFKVCALRLEKISD